MTKEQERMFKELQALGEEYPRWTTAQILDEWRKTEKVKENVRKLLDGGETHHVETYRPMQMTEQEWYRAAISEGLRRAGK